MLLRLLFVGIVTYLTTACSGVDFGVIPIQDNFSQSILYNNKVDILWIVDNSSSMQKHQERLNEQIPQFVQKLNTLKLDYHIGVVTTSMGSSAATGGKLIGSPKYLTQKTSQLESKLTERMLAGEDGSNLEQGLSSMETVLSSDYLAGEGKGFLRSDALLVVIALSDEDDFSVSDRNTSLTRYSSFLDTLKPAYEDGTKAWLMNFIGVLSLSSQCLSYNDYSSVGNRYLDLVDYSGGVKSSICTSNFSTAVSNVRARIIQILTDFKLSGYPVIETIVVKLNGVVVPQNETNGWTYFSQGNFIRFNGTYVPGAYDKISVDFTPGASNSL